MGSTLNVKLCPHNVWREKYGCSSCTDEEERPCRHCGLTRAEHSETRLCLAGGTSFWPAGELGGGEKRALTVGTTVTLSCPIPCDDLVPLTQGEIVFCYGYDVFEVRFTGGRTVTVTRHELGED
jgi:hypothetical protein